MTALFRITRRRLLAVGPATAIVALSAACSSPAAQTVPQAKSAAEQPKPTAPPAAGQSAPAAAQGSPKPVAAGSPSVAAKAPGAPGKSWERPPAMQIDPNKTYVATIKTSLGEMKAELYAKDSPNTVNNFVFLAREDFYDGMVFHRILKDFMVQTGDPTGTGTGSPGYRFGDELTNPRGYTKGTLAMANAGPNTQGSQFFICHGPNAETLPKSYTIFGKVTDGMDTLDKIASVPVQRGRSAEVSTPTDPPTIVDVTIAES